MRLCGGTIFCALFLLSAVPARAQGILFVEKETRNGQSTTNRIQIDKDHMRAESRSTGDETAFVFDGPKQTARMINISRKTYMEMTKSDLEQMSRQMNSMMAQMQAQLQAVPAAQRAMIEKMMQGRGMPSMGAAPATVEYRQAGSDKAGQWSCTRYEGYSGGQKTSEVCTVDPREFNLTAADFDVTRQLAEFVRTLAPDSADRMFVAGTGQDQGFSGIPVRRTSYRNGAVESVSEITEFRRETFPASTFEAPAGFRKEAMPSMPMGR